MNQSQEPLGAENDESEVLPPVKVHKVNLSPDVTKGQNQVVYGAATNSPNASPPDSTAADGADPSPSSCCGSVQTCSRRSSRSYISSSDVSSTTASGMTESSESVSGTESESDESTVHDGEDDGHSSDNLEYEADEDDDAQYAEQEKENDDEAEASIDVE